MFSNLLNNNSPGVYVKNNKSSIYCRFQSLFGRFPPTCDNYKLDIMLSARTSTAVADESFKTPVSSVADLMALSPKQSTDIPEQNDVTGDLLTGAEFDSICDVTMQEVPHYDDMFIDATSLDYLVKCAESNRNHNLIDRGKESLFVKFDPLYARKLGNSSASHTESVADSTDCGYETGSAVSVFTDVATPKQSMSTGSVHSVGIKDKPMQVVPPVVNSEAEKLNSNQSRGTPALVRSMSAILTPTQVTTDKLINFAGNTPPRAAPRSPRYHNYSSQEGDRLHTLRHILQKQDQEVLQLRQENRELKSLLQDGEHNHSRTIEHLEAKVKKLSEEKENMLERENKLLQQINDKIISNKQMSIVMEEYEKTISSLIGEQQREKISSMEMIERLIIERDQALSHLTSMEGSFNDLLSKYEKCKSIILECKEREKIFEQKIADYEAGMQKYDSLYNNLKQVTVEKLNNANETLDNLKKNHNVEITKLNAIIKKHEITIASLHESVIQKTRDNEELTRICDQLINDVR